MPGFCRTSSRRYGQTPPRFAGDAGDSSEAAKKLNENRAFAVRKSPAPLPGIAGDAGDCAGDRLRRWRRPCRPRRLRPGKTAEPVSVRRRLPPYFCSRGGASVLRPAGGLDEPDAQATPEGPTSTASGVEPHFSPSSVAVAGRVLLFWPQTSALPRMVRCAAGRRVRGPGSGPHLLNGEGSPGKRGDPFRIATPAHGRGTQWHITPRIRIPTPALWPTSTPPSPRRSKARPRRNRPTSGPATSGSVRCWRRASCRPSSSGWPSTPRIGWPPSPVPSPSPPSAPPLAPSGRAGASPGIGTTANGPSRRSSGGPSPVPPARRSRRSIPKRSSPAGGFGEPRLARSSLSNAVRLLIAPCLGYRGSRLSPVCLRWFQASVRTPAGPRSARSRGSPLSRPSSFTPAPTSSTAAIPRSR